MPNYANNYGTITAHNEAGKQLIQEWMDAYEKGNEDGNYRNFCDVFVPEPKWEDFLDGEGELQSGGWNGEKVWVEHDGVNRKLTDVEKKRMEDAGITEKIIGTYDFCSHVWGTKWGLCEDVDVDFFDDTLTFSGQSAWGPCDGMWYNVKDDLNAIAKKCIAEGREVPEIYVEHDWDERGCDAAGRIQVSCLSGVYEFHHNDWEIDEALELLGDDHMTLPDPQNYFYEKQEWGNAIFEGDDLFAYKDADLAFTDEGKPIIMMPSLLTAYCVGTKHEIVKAPETDEFYVIY